MIDGGPAIMNGAEVVSAAFVGAGRLFGFLAVAWLAGFALRAGLTSHTSESN